MAKKKKDKDWISMAVVMVLFALAISVLLWKVVYMPFAFLLMMIIWIGVIGYIIGNLFD